MKEFSLIITTHNRLGNLKFTLDSLSKTLTQGIKLLICDDGSSDGTWEWLKLNCQDVELYRNPVKKGLIFSRNLLMNKVTTPYVISLDDDANFLTNEPLKKIKDYFELNPRCGVVAFRIFWGEHSPQVLIADEKPELVKSFVGCGNAWRTEAWREIPDYPAWYEFYGEENYASFQLLKKDWEVYYLPSVLVQHRVDNKARKKDKDYYLRARKALRADWYNYIIFYPKCKGFRLFLYSVKTQFVKAFESGEVRIITNLFIALGSIIENAGKLKSNRNGLTYCEYQKWKKLSDTKIYWKPQSAQSSTKNY
ncbi:glycosyltransferase family 2 protein [Salegentibacter chungangensis]|uniref:Glycosyltransferase family 2 protein n=1 Tax=Salegentibacter chungangensis TaxID=1335724 RepID=A0ABW3NS70_9FLAO